jgi:hypothetical protein
LVGEYLAGSSHLERVRIAIDDQRHVRGERSRNGTILATCAISTAVGCGKCRLPSMIVTERITLTAELDALTEYWPQRVVAEVNGNLFKVAKAVGSTRWHSHDDQDERTAAHASPVRQEHEIPLL